MLTTKLAKKVLTKTEQKHLTKVGINSMRTFLEARKVQLEHEEISEPVACSDCQHIARKLGVA